MSPNQTQPNSDLGRLSVEVSGSLISPGVIFVSRPKCLNGLKQVFNDLDMTPSYRYSFKGCHLWMREK
jgi:hypothetical protein